MIAGKSIAFPKPGWAAAGDWGTDGGVHNFMRMLEDWGGQTISYRGAMISLYTARQMIGIYKANSNVYAPGTRAFAFDTNFLQPTLLPPGTPMFRDVNTLTFPFFRLGSLFARHRLSARSRSDDKRRVPAWNSFCTRPGTRALSGRPEDPACVPSDFDSHPV